MDILSRIFSRPDELPPATGDSFLVVGLGNPGGKYKATRHNIGFMAVDELARVQNTAATKVQHKALTAEYRLGEARVILAKPQTFMNLSGESVGALSRFYKIPPERVLVIYDELDLPLGTVRLREKGSAGGHNGMKSIIGQLGQEFPRLRLGIGRPPGQMPAHAYVLQEFGPKELELVREVLDTAVRATETFLREGIVLAMSRHNGKINEQ
ncbi:MAG: aminoacyl-tRNA hydrolase [Chloroflexi bacterium]|nr:aminoacyl-tRNA hydrolase [Chloroflexota bacterium]